MTDFGKYRPTGNGILGVLVNKLRINGIVIDPCGKNDVTQREIMAGATSSNTDYQNPLGI